MKKVGFVLTGILLVIAAATTLMLAQRSSPASPTQSLPKPAPAPAPTANMDFGKVPIFFIPNQGQTDSRVSFYIQGADKTVYFTPDGVTFALNYSTAVKDKQEVRKLFQSLPESSEPPAGKDPKRWTVKMDFVGARKDVKPEGLDKTGTIISYFKGKPDEWKTGLQACSKIIYRNLWPGIDLIFKGEPDRLKYEFIVHAGADPKSIQLTMHGADKVKIDKLGRLEISTPAGNLRDETPLAHQMLDGLPVKVPMAYRLLADAKPSDQTESGQGSAAESYCYGFDVGVFDNSRDLVLDPDMCIYSGFIGGSGWDFGKGIAVDAAGYAYVVGETQSDQTTFPVWIGPDLIDDHVGWDVFVAKVKPDGTGLVYCGYIGGAKGAAAAGIAVDAAGNAFVAGNTESDEMSFPVTGSFGLVYGGQGDGFVAKIDPSGTDLDYCVYIGGYETDSIQGIAVDGDGGAYVVGWTRTPEWATPPFPVTIGPNTTHNGGSDAFVAKINPLGTSLAYCGYIGGVADDSGSAIAVDEMGSAYMAGTTASDQFTFPAQVGPFVTHSGGKDVFVSKLKPDGTGFIYCGYIGGDMDDEGRGIALDPSGNAYITGLTWSAYDDSFPVTVGPRLWGLWRDGFVAKVRASGTSLAYCGYLGFADENDVSNAVAVDSWGNAYIGGKVYSWESMNPWAMGVYNWPRPGPDGYYDGFVAKIETYGRYLAYCGCIGNDRTRVEIKGIAVSPLGDVFVTGSCLEVQPPYPHPPDPFGGFRVKGGPDLSYNGGQSDAFVTKFGPPDNDGDGIEDIIDTDPLNYSNDFSDIPFFDAGTSYGNIMDRGDQDLHVFELINPRGIRISAGPNGGPIPATISTCGDSIVDWISSDMLDDYVFLCGSATVEVNRGPVEIHLVTDTLVIIPDETTAKITEIGDNKLDVVNVSGPGILTIWDQNQEILLAPGETAHICENDITPPVIQLSDPVCAVGPNGLKANKLTVSATDNCSPSIIPTIDKVELSNSRGKPVFGRTIYAVSGTDIFVYSNDAFSISVTATAADQSGNTAQLSLPKKLIKCK